MTDNLQIELKKKNKKSADLVCLGLGTSGMNTKSQLTLALPPKVSSQLNHSLILNILLILAVSFAILMSFKNFQVTNILHHGELFLFSSL